MLTAITQGGFWYLAIKYRTVFTAFEVALEITAVLWWIYLAKIATMEESEKKKKRERIWKELILLFAVLLSISMFICCSLDFADHIYWSEKIDLNITTKQVEIPEDLQELDVKFVCIHNPKEKKYHLCWVWKNGVYQISSYTEDECSVYRLPDSRQDLPKIKITEEKSYKYNYNYESYEEPRLVDTKTEKTYQLYVCESSYKELYTE